MSTLKGPLVNGQDVFSSTAPNAAGVGLVELGAYETTGDGRGFRYVLAGATALVPGKLYQGAAEDTSNQENLAVSAASAGATQVTITTSTTLAANLLAGAFATVTTSTGAGYTYKITSNTATAAATGCVLTLQDPLQTAIATSSRLDLHMNPYRNIVVNPAAASSNPVGVAVYPINAGSYGWLQTHGIVGTLADGTVTVGNSIVPSSAVAGAVSPSTAVGSMSVVGYAVTGIATTEYGLVFLTID